MQGGVPSAWGRGIPGLLLSPTLLLPSGSQALQCYSFQHIYFGPFDLSNMKLASVSCPDGCSEAVLSLDTGEGLRKWGREKRKEKKGVQKRKGWGDKDQGESSGREGRSGRAGGIV